MNTADGEPDAITVDGSVLPVRAASCDSTFRGPDVGILQHNGETSVPELRSFPSVQIEMDRLLTFSV